MSKKLSTPSDELYNGPITGSLEAFSASGYADGDQLAEWSGWALMRTSVIGETTLWEKVSA